MHLRPLWHGTASGPKAYDQLCSVLSTDCGGSCMAMAIARTLATAATFGRVDDDCEALAAGRPLPVTRSRD